ncbi:hypothetical protein FQR65_LT13353 [Abscondita terminalis]|nr:hypothetical protein FQR65_LT13353 [Abscondita terminalis]
MKFVTILLLGSLLNVSAQQEYFQRTLNTLKMCIQEENIKILDFSAIMGELKKSYSEDLVVLLKCCLRKFGKGYALNEISYKDLKDVYIPGVSYELKSKIIDTCRDEAPGISDSSFDDFTKCCLRELRIL